MTTKPGLLLLAMALALPASAQFRTVQLAHEVPLATVRLPASESGTLSFKTCDECPATAVRVTAETEWLVNRRSVSLSDFLSVIESRADRAKDSVTVRHHLEKDQITRVSIRLR